MVPGRKLPYRPEKLEQNPGPPTCLKNQLVLKNWGALGHAGIGSFLYARCKLVLKKLAGSGGGSQLVFKNWLVLFRKTGAGAAKTPVFFRLVTVLYLAYGRARGYLSTFLAIPLRDISQGG